MGSFGLRASIVVMMRRSRIETDSTIRGLSESTTRQVKAIGELAQALGNINEMSQSISAATEEQTTNAKQVSKAVENVNELTQAAASSAEEMSASTQQLSAMAQSLQRMVAQFSVGAKHGNATVAQPNEARVEGTQNATDLFDEAV